MKLKLTLLVLISLLYYNVIYSQQNSTSISLYNSLQTNDIQCTKQILSQSNSDNFPFSIIISPTSASIYPLHKCAIIINQSDVQSILPELLNFIHYLQNNQSPYQIDIILSANDYHVIPNSEDYKIPSGTFTYIDSLDTTEYTSIIIISSDNNKSNYQKTNITLSTKNISAPLNFSKNIIQSFKKTNISFSLTTSQLSLYRLGIIPSDSVLDFVLSQNIPAIHLTPQKDLFFVLQDFLFTYKPIDNENWDSQYGIINFFGNYTFLSETLLLILVLITIAIALFFVSFSFLFGTMALQHKQDLLQTIFVPIAILLILFSSLFLGQKVSQLIINNYNSVIFSFITKLLFSLILIYAFTKLRALIKLPQTTFIYGYLLMLLSLLDIVVFSLCDLSLFFFFVLQYIVINLSRTFTKTPLLIISLFLMFLPFSYLFSLSPENFILVLNYFANSSLSENILISLFIAPYFLLTIQILIKCNVLNNDNLLNKNQIKKIIITFCSFVLCFLILFTSNKIYFQISKQYSPKIITDNKNDHLDISFSRKFIYEKQEITLSINSKQPILRYKVSIYSPTLLPVYDANYPYDSITEKNKVFFNFDDYPPDTIKLIYNTSSNYESIISIVSYYLNSDNVIVKSEKQLLIPLLPTNTNIVTSSRK